MTTRQVGQDPRQMLRNIQDPQRRHRFAEIRKTAIELKKNDQKDTILAMIENVLAADEELLPLVLEELPVGYSSWSLEDFAELKNLLMKTV
jgi:hypothetical protein